MNPIIKPWPFRGWRINLIGQIYPPSSKNHKFILVAADYFTKWVEAVPLKNVTSKEMIEFVKEHIIYRFGIPQTITTDQGTMFTSDEFEDFATGMGIKLLNSSPYYAQANGQAEASNKGVIKLIKRKIDEYPRKWHTVLHEALWAYRMACHGVTKLSPYQLVYGHEAIIPWELKLDSRRVTFQNQLTADEYSALMKDELEDLAGHRLKALINVEANKARVDRWYDKKVKVKSFGKG